MHVGRLVALCAALALTGCAFQYALLTGKDRGVDVAAPRIDLLARGYLPRGESVRPGYGYYAYLVFLDNAEATRPAREAATRAFAQLLEDVREVEALQVPPARLAVLYLPVVKPPATSAPKDILDAYDYTSAGLLVREIERRGVTLPHVFLLGTPAPIAPLSPALPPELRLVELKGDSAAIESTLLRFRDSLLSPAQSQVSLLEHVRAFFESVGGFVLSLGTLGG